VIFDLFGSTESQHKTCVSLVDGPVNRLETFRALACCGMRLKDFADLLERIELGSESFIARVSMNLVT
jgi:hypothetical protein